ncbi:epoxyqueuosine reductase [Scopulibacillus darangshiensis]|uniref:Epoxyqueuosine reductase n=1 Tax=Scopulibacillus darangshiensis TaxID=442528 RepID=A0A4R2NB31_9BACL|nr:tRNA epoxyqueuosine(34) reductase QueG [Scopulibacillus darangshiensis]TCP18323.1 epoxyqueuosine reductase [Scopulibacillus darangshiensis]
MNDFRELKQKVIEHSKEIGIDKIGFTTADPFAELRARLYRQQSLGYQSGFEEDDIEKRVNPTLVMDGAQSVIAIALAYPAKMVERPKNTRSSRRGSFCRASWGKDYHAILRDRLTKLGDFIRKEVPEVKLKSMVDTGELSDRAVAERAGLGHAGKHTNVITKEYGSYVYLGEMITNIPFEPDEPATDLCGSCNLCVDHCPTGALVQGGQLNAQKCIAFLTQTKQDVPEYYKKAIGNRLYGCDTCQQVCPYNRGIDNHFHGEMEPEPEYVKPLLQPLLKMSNREFKEKYGHMAGSWRGKKPIQRNAIIALGNYKDVTAADTLMDVLKNDPRPVIRKSAAWALGNMIGRIPSGKKSGIFVGLKEVVYNEQDEDVFSEINNVLESMSD